MKKNETKLLSSIGINKIGNVMYDYGNSTWIAGLGAIGQKYLGYYQLAENIISLILNPIGGAVADRFKRRKILLVTDFIGGLMCALLALIGNDSSMLYGLITVNAVLAIMHAFSGTSFKSYVATIVEQDRLVTFNSRMEVISQVVSISSPLLAFLFVDRFGLKPTLVLDSVTFFLSFFFLLVIASLVNFFIAAFNYLAPFSNQLFHHASSYATLLSMGAAGSILGAVMANRLFQNSYNSILIALALCGGGLIVITLFAMCNLPAIVIVSGNFLFEFFLTIFNIHFFSMVQKKVPNHMLGRVFSSIFTVAILFMPLSTAIMKALPCLNSIYTFAAIGCGILMVSGGAYFYNRYRLG